MSEDHRELETLDTEFAPDLVMTVTRQGRSFVLAPRPLPRFSKRLPLEDLDGPDRKWDGGLVGGRDAHPLEAFLAWRFEGWNRRFSIWHLYVNANARRHGLARAGSRSRSDRPGQEGGRDVA
ncbi:MAG: hypothetical protein ACP5QO_09640 [Clostridia bacterium]